MMKRGFTLVEMLIAMSLFTLTSMLASNILVDMVQLEKKASIQNDLYEDLRIIMQQLTREIQSGTIDYEEYYSMDVIQSMNPPDGGPFYGINYGIYASRFYGPGLRFDENEATNPRDLGLECSIPSGDECNVFWTHSADLNTGKNPYNGGNANAFCDVGNFGVCGVVDGAVKRNELYLINNIGTKKTMIAKKLIDGNDYSVGLMHMYGRDLDQNGVIDVFSCGKDFNCYDGGDDDKIFRAIKYPFIQEIGRDYIVNNNIRLAQKDDLENSFNPKTTQFIPISPLRSSVKKLEFIISPVDDPYKAFGEKDMQTQPVVTIILTMGLSEDQEAEYPGEFTDITVQSTVASGMKESIISYPPVKDALRTIDGHGQSWIVDVLGPAGVP